MNTSLCAILIALLDISLVCFVKFNLSSSVSPKLLLLLSLHLLLLFQQERLRR